MVIKEGTASYAAWRETPIPVYTKFYFFDMLNPQVNVIDAPYQGIHPSHLKPNHGATSIFYVSFKCIN